MDTPSQQASLPFAILFWLLAIVAMSFVLLAAWQLRRSALQRPFEVAVETRSVNVLLRDVRVSKPQGTVTRLYGDYQLVFVRADTGQTVKQTEQDLLSKEELVSLEFLDRYAPGARLKAIEERDGSDALNLEPGNRWFGVVGILFGAWMFGTFAWTVRPFATGTEDPARGIILKFLSFAALLVAVVVFVALLDQRTKSGKELRPRVAMEILFSEPSCREPESLVQISAGGNSWMPMEQYRFLRDAQVLDGLAGLNIGMVANWRSTDRSYRLAATRVTDNFFEVTGIPIAMGRPIGRGEQDVTIITYGFWQQRLGADPNVLGRKLILDGQPYSIVGVLPREHRMLVGFGFTPDLYLTKDPVEVMVYGRLARGMGRQAARARLEPICRELDRVYPDANHKWAKDIKTSAVSGMERLTQQGMGAAMPLAAFFSMLVIVTGLVLLIACANVCSLLLARAFERSRELAVRMSLGGSRGRIVRQLLAESLLLAICGTSAGLLLNFWLTGLLRGVRIPTPLAIELLIQPDRRPLLYSIGIALGVTVAAGLVPAIRGTQMGISAVLKGHQGQAGSRRWTLRDALVAAQLAVSVLLLAGGFLFVNNLIRASAFDAGFDTEHTIVASVWAVPELCTPNRFARLSDAGGGALARAGGRRVRIPCARRSVGPVS